MLFTLLSGELPFVGKFIIIFKRRYIKIKNCSKIDLND